MPHPPSAMTTPSYTLPSALTAPAYTPSYNPPSALTTPSYTPTFALTAPSYTPHSALTVPSYMPPSYTPTFALIAPSYLPTSALTPLSYPSLCLLDGGGGTKTSYYLHPSPRPTPGHISTILHSKTVMSAWCTLVPPSLCSIFVLPVLYKVSLYPFL